MDQMEALREVIADQDSEVLDYLVFRRGNDLGVIYCTEDAEEGDEHCAECRNEVMAFRPRGPCDALPHYYLAVVGPTKFARIRAGWRDSLGLDLNQVEFLNG